jgi:hypothetical protein
MGTHSDILGLTSFSEITPQHTSLFARGMTSISRFTDVSVFPSPLDIDLYILLYPCFLFRILFSFLCQFDLANFCFGNLVWEEASFAGLLIVGLLSLGWVSENGQSLAAVKRLQPKRALFVGMTHDFEHESDNAALAEWSKRYQSIAFKHFVSVQAECFQLS